MPKTRLRIYKTFNVIADSVILAAALLIGYYFKILTVSHQGEAYRFNIDIYLWSLLIVLSIWHILLSLNGFYPTYRLRSLSTTALVILKTTIFGIAICVFIMFLFKLYFVGRVVTLQFALLSFTFLFVKEAIVQSFLSEFRERGIGIRNAIIIGDRELVRQTIEIISNNPHLGVRIIGVSFFDNNGPADKESSFLGIKVISSGRNICSTFLRQNVDNVILAARKENLGRAEDIISGCEEWGAEIWLFTDFFHLLFAKKDIDILDGVPCLIYRTTPQFSWALIFKRVIDIAGALVLFILALPLMLLTAIGIKFTSKGPVIFKQKRVGLHGRKFIFYKFRSMVNNAEQRRQEFRDRNIMSGPVFKVKDDPRITPFGKFLRKSSIDELPQLWNVLKGEMSLVGPRPPLPKEVWHYKTWQRRRLSMKPGLTCLWQIQGRNKITDFNRWAELDLQYIDNWSLWLDMTILFKTVFVVLLHSGAE